MVTDHLFVPRPPVVGDKEGAYKKSCKRLFGQNFYSLYHSIFTLIYISCDHLIINLHFIEKSSVISGNAGTLTGILAHSKHLAIPFTWSACQRVSKAVREYTVKPETGTQSGEKRFKR